MEDYSRGRHTVFYHRYHLVWITKYRYRVMNHEIKKRVRELVAQAAEEIGVKILNGVVSSDHVHIFAEVPPYVSVSDFVKRAKVKSSHKIQQEFPQLKKTYWGRHFWARGYFSATSGNVTDDVINEYINHHAEGKEPQNVSHIRIE